MNCLILSNILVFLLPISVSTNSEERVLSIYENSGGRSGSNERYADQSIYNDINNEEISLQDDNDIAWKEEANNNLDKVKAPRKEDEPLSVKGSEDTVNDIKVSFPFKMTFESEEIEASDAKQANNKQQTEATTKKNFESSDARNNTSISVEEPVCSRMKRKYEKPTYPYTVALLKKGMLYATGTLLNNGWILTTAAQFYNIRETIRLFTARLGSTDTKTGGVSLPLRSVHLHPSFVQGRPFFDLALLKIAKPVNYTKAIQASKLSQIRAGVVSAKFLVTYWPRLIINGQVIPASAKERVRPHSMRVSLQRMVPWEDCRRNVSSSLQLDHSILCLNPIAAHHSVCSPDPGAPVVARDGLWGVTSAWTTKNCTAAPSPTLMTRVSTPGIANWINEYVGNGTEDRAAYSSTQ